MKIKIVKRVIIPISLTAIFMLFMWLTIGKEITLLSCITLLLSVVFGIFAIVSLGPLVMTFMDWLYDA